LAPSPRAEEFNLQRLRTAGPSTSTRDTGTGPSTSCADPTGRSSTRTYVWTPTQRAERRRDSCIARCQQLTSRGHAVIHGGRTYGIHPGTCAAAHRACKEEERKKRYTLHTCILLAHRLLPIKVSAIYRLRDDNHPASMPGGQPPAPGMTDLLHCTELKYNDLSNYVKMYDYTKISLSFTSPT
jgi:hypothetical protein